MRNGKRTARLNDRIILEEIAEIAEENKIENETTIDLLTISLNEKDNRITNLKAIIEEYEKELTSVWDNLELVRTHRDGLNLEVKALEKKLRILNF